MPLTEDGQSVLTAMMKKYGSKRGKQVFYASINKGVPGSKKWHKMKGKGKSKYTEALAHA